MPRFRSCWLALALTLVCAHEAAPSSWSATAAAAKSPPPAPAPPARTWKLPPVDGELAGELDAILLGGAPRVKWKLALRTPRPREREVDFELEARGLKVKGSAQLDPAGEGTWRLAESTIDLGEWFGWVMSAAAPSNGGLTLAGALTLSGEGSWRGGQLGGKASLSLREGRLDDPAHHMLLEGISVDVEIADLAKRRTEPEQVFTWRNGRYDVVDIGVGRVEFMLDGTQIRVNNAAIDVFGGELRVGALAMSTARPEFSVTATVTGIGVDKILFLLPPVLSEAKGMLDGNVALKRDEAGVEIGNSRLALREGETADLRLAIKPGWLTTSLPPEIVKVFPGFRKIETGEIPIRARTLEITITPLGDAKGRTAWVHVAGGPSDPDLTAPIDTTVNVRGSLDELIDLGARMGASSRLRFGKPK